MATTDFVVKNGLVVTEEAQILGTTDATSATDTAAAVYTAGGVAIAKKAFVGTDLAVVGNTVLTGDIAVNGGDITTNQVTFNLVNATAATVNFAGAATDVQIGAATGTVNINNNLDVDGDVNIDGGDLTVSTAAFNLANTTATTVNAFGAAATLTLGATTGTATVRNPTVTLSNATTVNVNGASPTFASTSTGTLTLFNTNLLTATAFGAATTVNIGNATAAQTISIGNASIGASTYNFATAPTATGNTKTVNIGTAGASGSTTNVNIGSSIAGVTTVNSATLVGALTTQNVFNTLATTVNAFGAAGTIAIGANSGTITIGNPTLVGTQATQNVYNTVATAVNFAGAATAVIIGAATGITRIRTPQLRIGSSDTANFISFRGTTDDGPGSFNHTYIGERIHTATEASELLIFKGNDPIAAAGPDRVRVFAGEFRVDTYTAAVSDTFENVGASTAAVNRMLITSNGQVTLGADIASTTTATGTLVVTGGVGVAGTVHAAGFTGPLTGNATTATTLADSRTLWGQTFNGSANVSGALTGVTSIEFAAEASDAASISTTVTGNATFFNFNLADDNNNDEWRWRFTPSGAAVYNAMRLVPVTNTTANLIVSGSATAGGVLLTGNLGTVTSVGGTAPVASSGGTAPVISLNAAYGDTLNPYASKTAKHFLAAPNAAAGVPGFRSIVASDIPTLNQNTTGTAAVATTVTLVATDTTNAAHFITFVDTATGNRNVRTDTSLTFNPLFNTLTANGMIGVTASEMQLGGFTNPAAGNFSGANIRVFGGTAKGTGGGGDAVLEAGDGSVDQSSVSAGGNVAVTAGDGGRNSTTVGGFLGFGGDGGNVAVTAGNTHVGGTGAVLTLIGGRGNGTQPAATVLAAANAGGASNTAGGGLLLYAGKGTGTGVGGAVQFFTSGTTTAGTGLQTHTSRLEINNLGRVAALANIASTTTATGTLVVTGGVGVSGAVHAAGFTGPLTGNATTATTLQTTRAINGTNFNGSAAITTANWGTARDINGTSINGSGNYAIGRIYDTNFRRFTNPGGGEFVTQYVGTVTGAIEIVFPNVFSNGMYKMVVEIYEYTTNESFTVYAAGHTTALAMTWLNTTAYIVGNPTLDRRFNIRFGRNAANKAVIYVGEIGSSWSYPQVFLTEFQCGYAGFQDNSTGWAINFRTAALENVSQTISNCQVGYAVSTNTANSNVLRDASGNFSAGTITAALAGNAASVTNGVYTIGNQSIAGVKTFTNGTASTNTTTGSMVVTGGVGVSGNVNVGGALNAVTKSFLIDHPTRSSMKLQYGSLEGPELGVYVRGKLIDANIIELPNYWTGLVHADSITVNLTACAAGQRLYVDRVENNCVYIVNETSKPVTCYYTVYGERKDVDKLVVEIE